MKRSIYATKNRLYALTAAALLAGAVFYGGGAILGQHVSQASPIKAGAQAAKPSGVPSCLAACPGEEAHAVRDNETSEHPAAHPTMPPSPLPSMHPPAKHIPPPPLRTHPPVVAVHSRSTASASSHAHASGKQATASASAKAVAIANNTTVVRNTTVVKNSTTVVRPRVVVKNASPPQDEPEATAAPQPRTVKRVTVVQSQPSADEPEAAQVQPAPQPVTTQPVAAAPLPATGTAAVSGIVGSSALIGALYYYLRSRRRLIETSRQPRS